MRDKDLSILSRITLSDLESTLDEHTCTPVPVDRWTEFTWSASRHRMFVQCPRLYYLYYYGARRVREARDPVVSAIWWLKQVVTLPMWIGTVVHHIARTAVLAHREGHTLTPTEIEDQAIADYYEGYQASKRGAKHGDKWVILSEHLYPGDPAALDCDLGAEHLLSHIRALLNSEIYNLILSLPPEAILEVDEPFQSFNLTGIPRLRKPIRIFAIPDVLLRHGDRLVIVDWKTGDVSRDSIRDQAGVYRLYTHLKYGVPEDRIDVHVADLASGGQTVPPPGGAPSVEEARTFIHTSIAAMVEQMNDFEYNTAQIARFPMIEDRSVCQGCAFRRACWRHEMSEMS